ncbi:MAG: carbonic anhydrase [Pacificimonas sp.]
MPAFRALLDGYRRFRVGPYQQQRLRFDQLADKGQHPGLMVISCCDSRVDPAQIFDVEPGQIFVLRNVANLVPPFEKGGGLHGVSAAVEFAVTQLDVSHILILGHGGCGGCKAALSGDFDGNPPGEGFFISEWLSLLTEARSHVAEAVANGADEQLEMEYEAVRTSLHNLETFPFVAERLSAGRLQLHGGHFAVAHGELHLMDEEGKFGGAADAPLLVGTGA